MLKDFCQSAISANVVAPSVVFVDISKVSYIYAVRVAVCDLCQLIYKVYSSLLVNSTLQPKNTFLLVTVHAVV